MGTAVVGATLALAALPATRVAERDWFAAFGYVAGAPVLWAAGLAALVPGLMAGYRAGGSPFVARMLHALLAAGLMWRHLVPALWVLVLPALISGVIRRRWGVLVAMLPPVALAALGGAAWARGMVSGVWFGLARRRRWPSPAWPCSSFPLAASGALRTRKSHGSPRRAPGLPRR